MSSDSQVFTLKCIKCEREVLKIGVREGEGKAKLKAVCPCGSDTYSKTVEGRFWIAPEPGLMISESQLDSPDIEDEQVSAELGTVLFIIKERPDGICRN